MMTAIFKGQPKPVLSDDAISFLKLHNFDIPNEINEQLHAIDMESGDPTTLVIKNINDPEYVLRICCYRINVESLPESIEIAITMAEQLTTLVSFHVVVYASNDTTYDIVKYWTNINIDGIPVILSFKYGNTITSHWLQPDGMFSEANISLIEQKIHIITLKNIAQMISSALTNDTTLIDNNIREIEIRGESIKFIPPVNSLCAFQIERILHSSQTIYIS